MNSSTSDRVTRNKGSVLRRAVLPIFIVLLFGFAAADRAQAVTSRPFLEHGPQFAIADFDRDGSLDIVWVKGAPDTTTSVVDYTIELQLSARGRKSIHILAPAGGLILRARDVNRDNAIDLALVTAGSKKAVALFLNDGSGGFYPAEPAAFPEAFSNPGKSWDTTPNQETQPVLRASRVRDGTEADAGRLLPGLSELDSVSVRTSEFFVKSRLSPQAGRAPPHTRFIS